jgi:hypothetical protein
VLRLELLCKPGLVRSEPGDERILPAVVLSEQILDASKLLAIHATRRHAHAEPVKFRLQLAMFVE